MAVFLPIVSDMSGCSGNQAVAVSMRELALGLVRPKEVVRVLVKEMQSLCLNVEMLSAGEEVEFKELEEDVFRTAASLGIDISRPEKAESDA